MEESRIARINELAHKAKAEGLSDEEIAERDVLRREYIDAFKGNLATQLESIRIKNPDGTLTKVQKKKK